MTYYGEKNRIYQKHRQRKKVKEQKILAFNMLGGKCVNCGIDDIRVLQIDHIKPIRRKRINGRFSNKQAGHRLRKQIVNKNISLVGLQLLCANCHQIKTYEEFFGYIEKEERMRQ